MTNAQIIATVCIAKGIYTHEQINSMAEIPVHTYQYWKAIGYQVRKGEKAAIKTRLWKMAKTQNIDDDPEKEKTPKLILVKSYLFTLSQVEKIQGKPEKKSAQKKTSSATPEKSAQKETSSAPQIVSAQEIEKLTEKSSGTSKEAALILEKTGYKCTDAFAKGYAADIMARFGKSLEEYFAA